MKKILFMAAIAALTLASCSSDEIAQSITPAVDESNAVMFDTYTARTTKAADGQLVNDDYIKANGFGVFAFDQGTQSLSSYTTTNATPNFFYNQKVSASVKEYNLKSPISNEEYAAIDNGVLQGKYSDVADNHTTSAKLTPAEYDALTKASDKALCTVVYNDPLTWTYSPLKYWPNNVENKVSFYAYAPYQKDLSTNATPNEHGLRLILATNSNGPAIQYTVPSGLSAGIDLCWGASAEAAGSTSPVDLVKNPATGSTQSILTDQKIKFNFKHALTKIAFNIQAWYDKTQNGHANTDNETNLDPNTKITVRSIKLIGAFASKGILSLYDGKWNAEKGVSQEVELLNEAIVMTSADDHSTETALFNGDAIMLIPGGSFQIQVTYDVETTDAVNSANSSKVTNKILSQGTYDLEEGVSTAYHLNLGLTSVKFDAKVINWTDKAATEVDLPNNTTVTP